MTLRRVTPPISPASCSRGAQGPGVQQVENVLLGAGQLHRKGRFELLIRLRHDGLHVGGIEVAAIWLGFVPEEGVGRVQQSLRQC